MNWFPQMDSGSVTQFPFKRTRSWRAIRNELESGERILLPDHGAGQIDWVLSYTDLSDTEQAKLRDLFNASNGTYGAFGFIDPLANLLGWSEDLTKADWQTGLATVATGIDDPKGGQHGWSVTNGSAGAQRLSQTISLPGEYVSCFSAWIRSSSAQPVILSRDGVQLTTNAGTDWKRVFVSGQGAAGASNATFAIELSAGQTLQVWCPQVEAQPYPSQYRTSGVPAGICEETYFATDELNLRSTGPGLSACEVRLLSRV